MFGTRPPMNLVPTENHILRMNARKVDVEAGEKLCVTADKWGETGGCRSLCWTLLGLVVAANVVLIVLAASNGRHVSYSDA